jgi:lipopolysaccharide export system permease protein
MRLLDRFLLRELAIPLAYCLAGFLLFWITFDLVNEIDHFQEARLHAIDIVEIYLVRTPELLFTVMPVALLLGLLYTLAHHSRHHEITAMRAAGISLWRISLPYFGVGLLFSAALFWIGENAIPEAADRERRIKARRNADASDAQIIRNLSFRNSRDNRIWNIRAYNPNTFEMTDPHVEWRLKDGSRRILLARSGIRTNDQWRFVNATTITYPAGRVDTNTIPIKTNSIVVPEFTETPFDIQVQVKFSRLNAVEASKRPQLSLREIHYIEHHIELNPRDRAILATQRQARLAQPWICLIIPLIALPFGAASGRRNVFIGVAASIFICFGFFVLQRLSLALGTGQYIPPGVAAWVPNGVFGAAGLWLTHRVK